MYAYPRSCRLLTADEFSSVFNFRRVSSGKYLKIHYKPNELENSRLGLIISKRIHKRANKRNYMKRVLRELFRQSQPSWPAHDIVIRVMQCFTAADFVAIKDEFAQLVKKFAAL